MGYSKDMLPDSGTSTSSGSRSSSQFGTPTLNVGSIDKGSFASKLYGISNIPRPYDVSLESPFSKSIPVLEEDYNTWLASSSNPYDSQLSEVKLEKASLPTRVSPTLTRDYSTQISAAQDLLDSALDNSSGVYIGGPGSYLEGRCLTFKEIAKLKNGETLNLTSLYGRDVPVTINSPGGGIDWTIYNPFNEAVEAAYTYGYIPIVKPYEDKLESLKALPTSVDNPVYKSYEDFYNDRLKSLESSKASYDTSFDIEKTNRLSDIETLKNLPSLFNIASGASTGRRSSVSSKFLPEVSPVKVYKSSGSDVSALDLYFSKNPYTSSLEDLSKKKSDWEVSVRSDPFSEAEASLNESRASYNSTVSQLAVEAFKGYETDAGLKSLLIYDPVNFTLSIDWSKSDPRASSLIPYVNSWNSQDFSSLKETKGSLDSQEALLKEAEASYNKDKSQALSSFSGAEKDLRLRSGLFESSKGVYEVSKSQLESTIPSEGSKGVGVTSRFLPISSKLTDTQISILTAYKEGQRDLEALSTYSGLSTSDVTKVLQELMSKGLISSSGVISSSRSTQGNNSSTSSNFWKRVTSI